MSEETEKLSLAAEEPIPTLTLDPMMTEPAAEQKAEKAADPLADVEAVVLDESSFTPAEQQVINDFAQQIDITNANMILQYGAAPQKKIADFSSTALNNVRTKDLGQVGEMLTGLVGELRNFEAGAEEQKGFFGFFKKTSNNIANMKTKYNSAEVNVNKIVTCLEDHQVQLMKDVAMLDEMYKKNLTYFKELSMYIVAGKKKLQKVLSEDLPALKEKAQKSGLPEDAQAANDLANLCDRFEKKLHDLELTRMISIQMSPQIRLVQNNDTIMSEKIQSTIVNTIPLWKSQMVIALGIAHSQQAMEAQREVTNMTNDLLRKNADALKMATVETARESERGIVDMETLKHTNETLISTLDEVVKIQAEGREKRKAAELELGKLEGQLKQKLLDIKD
ncbi:MAG: toxic anion resistance protein [Oscillospiraceae bacterium]|nr:toxic anion resistance protein [Oscillospiraceae bacterium]